MANDADQAKIDYNRWTYWQYLCRALLFFLLHLVANITVEGQEHIPSSGAFLAAGNHLHMLDAPLGFSVISRPMAALTKAKWRKVPFCWFMEGMGHVIYVEAFDRQTFRACINVLKAGGVLAIFPEGTRSRTGALGHGHTGIAQVSLHTSTLVVPVAMFGQEQAFSYWKKFRRVPVQIRIGPPIQPPSVRVTKVQLQMYTADIMYTLAQLLPSQYRGIYSEPAGESDV